ncbi:MAG: (4Fe-4S)-binding protein [Alphaproteobacteria bacterium]|nr:(4Fe-4S)-binding protein [Alphaproteobacteria bacterium]
MKIAVASGKGGTGKTTVAVNLALCAERDVQLLDCDVEEPNVHLFLSSQSWREREVSILVPDIIEARCTAAEGCRDCADFCQFGAISCFGTVPVIAPEMCHGCGGCRRVCRKKAIREIPERIGVVRTARRGSIDLVEGRLDIGRSLAPVVIRSVKDEMKPDALTILDAPPGTSCPVVAALRDSDFAVLVTEPTPFGLNDLRLAVAVARELEIPFGVVVNRSEPGRNNVTDYCRSEEIELLAEIPDDRRIAEAYAAGVPAVEALPGYRPLFHDLLHRIWSRA